MYFAFIKKKSLVKWFSIIIAIFLFIIPISKNNVYAVFSGKPLKELPIYYVKTEGKKIAISFDCAWGVDYTDKLLSIMQENDVKSTFFMVEFWVKKHPDYVKKIFDFGHEVATHSATHPHMSKLSKSQIQQELITSTQAITEITKKKPILFRAPFGEYNDVVIQTALELGLYTIQWDVDSLDWKDYSANKIAERVLKKVKSGSIVLFHNQGLHTAQALPIIIKSLKQQGYSFVPIGELIYKENYIIEADGGQKLIL